MRWILNRWLRTTGNGVGAIGGLFVAAGIGYAFYAAATSGSWMGIGVLVVLVLAVAGAILSEVD